ncbi:uncharacterized protein LOC109543619 [Dendroctonus ponderosae]|uniref:Uncharacterized protein n=2 Tax=Dendroctonus ponderosae TaxID=77166 RepID=A0AAR5Q6Y0_DENPD|nr:uncharacterized protein LOC109543619 [Dendroctonus ponderosae]KAH1014165.1 hypothetical protein HUJ04_003050 [Dendroctonus ponderosae]KAH1023933.1 hypothetical protein HUJ05_003507 [Dendroctonus ponderosae]
MNFIHTPARSTFNAENAHSNIQRKAGSSVLQTRTPFQDKAVNCRAPNSTFKKPNADIPTKQNAKSLHRPTRTDTEILEDFCYTDYDEQFEELYSIPLSENDIFTFLNNYLDAETPPPSPKRLAELDTSVEELNDEELEPNYKDYFGTPLFKSSFENETNLFNIRCPTPPVY